jgi:hypothetical protein
LGSGLFEVRLRVQPICPDRDKILVEGDE